MNVLQTLPAPVPDTGTSVVLACRTCHALFESPAPRPPDSMTGAGRRGAEAERFCSKACRHTARRRGR